MEPNNFDVNDFFNNEGNAESVFKAPDISVTNIPDVNGVTTPAIIKFDGTGEPIPDEEEKKIRKKKPGQSSSPSRYHKLIHMIFDLCELSGFQLEGRIHLVDKKTGKRYE